MEKRDIGLDLCKVFAMFLVSFGHFVGVGTYATEIPFVFSDKLSSPLIPVNTHAMWKVEAFLFKNFHIEFAVIGCVIFFFISGYFIPQMQRKYKNELGGVFLHFYKNSLGMISLSVLCVVLIEYITQGLCYRYLDIVAQIFIVPTIFGTKTIMPVFWWLTSLVCCYFISTLIPRFSLNNVVAVLGILLCLVVLPSAIKDSMTHPLFGAMAFYSRYIPIIMVGVVYRLLKEKDIPIIYQCLTMIGIMYASYFIANVYTGLYHLNDTYIQLNTYIAATLIIVIIKIVSFGIDKYEWKNIHKITGFLSGLFLPFYLIHVYIGLNVIYLLRAANISAYICVLGAWGASGCFAYLIKFLSDRYAKSFINQLL